MTGSFRRLALLALAIIAWALADQKEGNGFIAAFVGKHQPPSWSGLRTSRKENACSPERL